MIAALGMYARAENAAAHNALWVLVRDSLRQSGIAAPDALSCGDAAFWPAWESPKLLLGQTCALPFRAKLHTSVTLIGAPVHNVDGCTEGKYHSVFIARKSDTGQTPEDFISARFAYNDPLSQSGWAAPYTYFHARGLALRHGVESGSHRASAENVAHGRADFAAIDQVSFSLIATHDDFASTLKIIGKTPQTPALPFITAQKNLAPLLRSVLQDSIAKLSPKDRYSLRLEGITDIPVEDYLRQPIPPNPSF